jgi:hypothetical protein
MLTALGLAVVDLEYVGRALVLMAGRQRSCGAALHPPGDDDRGTGPASAAPVGGNGSLVSDEKHGGASVIPSEQR